MNSSSKRSHSLSWDLCRELQPEDGLDPRLLRRSERRQPSKDRNARQVRYCHAVKEALASSLYAIAGERDLQVLQVEATPSGAGLLVIIGAPVADLEDLLALERSLAAHAGYLRAEVAQQVTRKRTPPLTFRVLPEENTQIEETNETVY